MLTRMRLRNFKSWGDTGRIPLRPITAFFGTNSSGKSSLLQALLLLKQTSDSSDRGLVFHFGDKATLVDLGDFASVVHDHDTAKSMEVSLDWKTARPFKVADTKHDDREVVESRRLGFSVIIGQKRNAMPPRPAVDEMSYGVGDARFGMRRQGKDQDEYDVFAEAEAFRFIRSLGRKWPLPPPIKGYGFPDQTRAYYQNAGFLPRLALELERRLDSISYLGPLRASPERHYTWAGAEPRDVGRAGEAVVDALLAARERGPMISPGYRRPRVSLETYVAQWLKDLGLIHDFRVMPIGDDSHIFQVRVRRTCRSPEVLITDVGFGVSQILPVMVLCFFVPECSTVILEQPEIHLHPAVQSGLADVLIAARQTRKVQILLESHSEHLLRRLQRRIAEEKVAPNDVGLFFCDAGGDSPELRELDIDLLGNITNWPENFFGDEFGEIAAMTKAAQKRRNTAAGAPR